MTLARENRLASGILLALLALISLPYLFAALIVPPGEVWGGLIGSADDQNVHLMWARQAQDGAFFVRDLFTTEGLVSGERPLFFNLLTHLMGWLARLTGLEVVFFYHAFRVALAAVALWQLHRLSRAVTNDEERWAQARIWTLALAAFTTGAGFLNLSGISWLDRPDNANLPLVPEAFLLLSALLYPLNVAGFALLAFVFTQIVRGEKPIWAFIGALLLANIHTYDALPLVAVALVWAIWSWKTNRANSVVALASIGGALLPILYQFLVFRGSEEFRVKALTVTAPPAIWHIVLTFAPLLILAIFGWRAAREFRARNLLVLWAVLQLALLYAPVSFARKMIEGWQIPLLVLAGIGLWALLEKLPRSRALAGVAIVGILAISPLQTFGWLMNNYSENNESRLRFWMPPLRLLDAEAEALKQLDRAPEFGAVLSLPYLGSYIPRASGKATYAGHWAETLDINRKIGDVRTFFAGTLSPEEAREFLRANQIRYVLVSRYERALPEFRFDLNSLGLRPLWSGGDGENRVEIYEFVS